MSALWVMNPINNPLSGSAVGDRLKWSTSGSKSLRRQSGRDGKLLGWSGGKSRIWSFTPKRSLSKSGVSLREKRIAVLEGIAKL